MLEVVLLQHANCARHSFRDYVQNILAPEFVWIRIAWDTSQAATVDRGSGRKVMQNQRFQQRSESLEWGPRPPKPLCFPVVNADSPNK